MEKPIAATVAEAEALIAGGHDLDAVSLCTPPAGRHALAAAAIEAILGRKAQFVCSPGTYDQKHIDRIGKLKNCIAYGPGILDLAHQPDEWVGVDDMLDSARVLALTLAALLR